jgi:hypothetical protein
MDSTLPPASPDDLLRKRAKKRVEAKMGWLIHATVFVAVNLLLLAINAVQGAPRWHIWPLSWWGLGLAIHGAVVLLSLRGDGLKERMLQREIEALRRREGR